MARRRGILEEAEIKKFPTYFTLEKEILTLHSRYYQKSIIILECHKENEAAVWGLGGTQEENLLSFLYFQMKDFDKAFKISNAVLEKDPSNLLALSNQAMFHLKSKVSKVAAAKEKICKLRELKGSPSASKYEQLVVQSIADLAFAYGMFGFEYYPNAIMCYKQALDKVDRDKLAFPEQIVLVWRFCLAQKYNQMLNIGNACKYSDFDPDLFFEKIKENLMMVIKHCKNKDLVARAWCELGDAYKKYETKGRKQDRTEKLPENMTVHDCMEKAKELGPKVPYVLERCGRHCRQNASNKEDFKTAIEYLTEAINISPARHVAYHHLGLAYRSLWHEEADHEPRKMHTTKGAASVGRKKKKKGKQARKTQSSQLCFPGEESNSSRCDYTGKGYTCAGASVCQAEVKTGDTTGGNKSGSTMGGNRTGDTTSGNIPKHCQSLPEIGEGQSHTRVPDEECRKKAVYSNSHHSGIADTPQNAQSLSSHADCTEMTVSSDMYTGSCQNCCLVNERKCMGQSCVPVSQVESTLAQQTTPSGSNLLDDKSSPAVVGHGRQTSYSRCQVDIDKIPPHKKPTYFDKLRVQNPSALCDSSTARNYLEKAKDCFQKASEVVCNTSPRYFIDLARCFVSLGDNERAESLFQEAHNDDIQCNPNDAAYLYEQWALMRQSTAEDTKNQDNVEEVMDLYKQSIENVILSHSRSRVAYYHLESLLAWQTQNDPSNVELKWEYAVINMRVGNYDKAQASLEKVLDTCDSEDQKSCLEKLIEVYFKQKKYKSAHMYVLELLSNVKKEDLCLDGEVIVQVILETAYKRGKENPNRGKQMYSEMFVELMEYFHGCSNLSAVNPHSDVALLAAYSSTAEYQTIYEIMEDRLGLKVFSGAVENSDITPGMSIIQGYEEPLLQSRMVLIFSDEYCQHEFLQKLTDETLSSSERSSRICCITSRETEPPFGLRQYPRINMSNYMEKLSNDEVGQENVKKQLILDLYKMMVLPSENSL